MSMSDYVNNVYNIESSRGVIKITGRMNPIRDAVRKMIGKKKIDNILLTHKPTEIRIYEFFVPHLIAILEGRIESVKVNRYVNIPVKPLNRVVTLLKEKTYYKDVISAERMPSTLNLDAIKDEMLWEPLPHQLKAFDVHTHIKEAYGLRGMYLEGQIGSGKTAMSLMLAIAQEPNYIVIIAPSKTVHNVWIKTITIADAFKRPQDYWFVNDRQPYSGQKFIISNYESSSKLDNVLKTLGHNYVLIVDEAHGLNDRKSAISQRVQDYVVNYTPKDVILMSGTPLKMSPQELIPIMTILDKRFTSKVRKQYEKLFRGLPRALTDVIPESYARYRVEIKNEANDVKDMPEIKIEVVVKKSERFLISTIREEMQKFVKARVKEDKPLLPQYEMDYILLRDKGFLASNTPKSNYDRYKELVRLIISTYKDGRIQEISDEMLEVNKYEKNVIEANLEIGDRKRFRLCKTMYKYPMLRYMGEALGKIVAKARMDASLAIVEAVDLDNLIDGATKKVLIFSNYIKVAEAVMDNIHAYKGLGVFGDTSNKAHQYVERLGSDPSLEYISTTYKSLGDGVPIIMCNRTIAIEKPFRDYLWQQALGRTERLGQDSPTDVVTFIMKTDEPNIYDRTTDLLTESYWNVKYLTSGTNDVIDEWQENATVENTMEHEITELIAEYDMIPENITTESDMTFFNEKAKHLSKLTNDELLEIAKEHAVDLVPRVQQLNVTEVYKADVLTALESALDNAKLNGITSYTSILSDLDTDTIKEIGTEYETETINDKLIKLLPNGYNRDLPKTLSDVTMAIEHIDTNTGDVMGMVDALEFIRDNDEFIKLADQGQVVPFVVAVIDKVECLDIIPVDDVHVQKFISEVQPINRLEVIKRLEKVYVDILATGDVEKINYTYNKYYPLIISKLPLVAEYDTKLLDFKKAIVKAFQGYEG